MSFSADWLALRSDADREARNADLAAELAVWFGERDSVRVLDLGAGTGATLDAVSPILPAQQTWRLADNDADLLAGIAAPDGVTIETALVDLNGDLSGLFNQSPDAVTASAFFDLCGAAMIDRLAAQVIASGAAFYAALSYDGRQMWEPEHPLDEAVLAAFDADQKRDKGMGPALGPEAATYLADVFKANGYAVQTAQSDWVLTPPEHAQLIAELARGSADAVAGALGTEAASDWHRARMSAEKVTIGHVDVLALPPG